VQRFSKQRTLYWIGYTCESQTWRINREIAVLPPAIPSTQPVRQPSRRSGGRVYRPLCHPSRLSLYTFTSKSNLAWMVYQLQRMYLAQTLPGWQQITLHVEFEALTVVVMKRTIFWDITPCSPLEVNRRFEGTSPPYSGPKNKLRKLPAWKQVAVSCSAHSSILKL
jgi:hypothetical protein